MISLQKIIDRYLGNALCVLLSPFNGSKKSLNKPKKIIVIKLWAMGESILTLPMINILRKKYPKSQIDVLVRDRNKAVYTENKDIDNIVSLDQTSFLKLIRKYDVAIDCEPYLNISAILGFFSARQKIGFSHGLRRLLYNFKTVYNDEQPVPVTYADLLQHMGLTEKPDRLIKLPYSKEDAKNVENILKKLEIKKTDTLIGFSCGAAESGHSRMWPEERFAKLAEKIVSNKNTKVLLIGGPGEQKINKRILPKINKRARENVFDLAGKTKLKESFYLIEKCKVFISNDTGPMHVGAAQGCKTVGLFGPNLPIRFGPFGPENSTVYKGEICEYSPCINVHKGQVPDCLYKRDSKDYQKCMLNITVDDVFNKI